VYPVVLEKIHGVHSTRLWAVGNSAFSSASGFGLIRYFDGQAWSTQLAQAPHRLNDIFAVTTQVVWAAGDGGLILYTNMGGHIWQAQSTPTTQSLLDIEAASATEAWAVGNAGTILRTDDAGQTWTSQVSGTSQNLIGISVVSPSEAWAVGTAGTILHTTDGGTTWITQTSGTTVLLTDVVGTSSLETWAVGQGGLILHTIDGGQNWQVQTSGTSQTLVGLSKVPSSATLWAVGHDGTILQYNGSTWQTRASGTSLDLGSVVATSSSEAWATAFDGSSVLLHYDGNNWGFLSEAPVQSIIAVRSIFNNTTQNYEVWATGSEGAIIHSSDHGRSWRTIYPTTSPKDFLYSLAVPQPRQIWAAGFGTAKTGGPTGVVVHFNGISWARHETGGPYILHGVAAGPTTQAWAVGVNGTITHTADNGATWTLQNSQTANALYSVAAVSDTEAWAVGETGLILRTTDGGQNWIAQPSGTSRDLRSVAVDGGNQLVWIVGADGWILQYDIRHNRWLNHTGITSEHLNAVSTGLFGTWIAGDNGTLLWGDDVVNWYTLPSATNRPLFGVSESGTRTPRGVEVEAWASSGDYLQRPAGLIMHYRCTEDPGCIHFQDLTGFPNTFGGPTFTFSRIPLAFVNPKDPNGNPVSVTLEDRPEDQDGKPELFVGFSTDSGGHQPLFVEFPSSTFPDGVKVVLVELKHFAAAEIKALDISGNVIDRAMQPNQNARGHLLLEGHGKGIHKLQFNATETLVYQICWKL